MKITQPDPTTLSMLDVVHDGRKVSFNAGSYDKPAKGVMSEIFIEINAYWETLPKERLDKMFVVYQNCREIFNEVYDTRKLPEQLSQQLKNLFELNPRDEIDYWVNMKTNIGVPSSMKEKLGPNDPEDRTYLRADYAKLNILAIRLRIALPILGEFIQRITPDVGANFKEMVARRLLATSDVFLDPAYKRLEKYIDKSVSSETTTTASVLGGIGSSDMPEWLLSLALIRKVIVVPVTSADDKNNIVSAMYRIVRNSVDTVNRKFNGAINEKRRASEGKTEDDNTSSIENYKVKQEIADGDLIAISVYAENVEELARRVDDSIDIGLVRKCCMEAQRLESMAISTLNLTLTQWCLSRVIPARGVPALNKPTLLRLMGVTQAALSHWGFGDLALLVMASPRPIEDSMLGIGGRSTRLPKDLADKLCELYPHYQETVAGSSPRQKNPAYVALDVLSRHIAAADWKLNGAVLPHEGGERRNERFIVPSDIKVQIAELIIQRIARGPEAAVTNATI